MVIASDGIWEQLKPEEVGRLVVESAESARAVTSQFAGTVTAAFTVWLSKFGCTGVFTSVLDILSCTRFRRCRLGKKGVLVLTGLGSQRFAGHRNIMLFQLSQNADPKMR